MKILISFAITLLIQLPVSAQELHIDYSDFDKEISKYPLETQLVAVKRTRQDVIDSYKNFFKEYVDKMKGFHKGFELCIKTINQCQEDHISNAEFLGKMSKAYNDAQFYNQQLMQQNNQLENHYNTKKILQKLDSINSKLE